MRWKSLGVTGRRGPACLATGSKGVALLPASGERKRVSITIGEAALLRAMSDCCLCGAADAGRAERPCSGLPQRTGLTSGCPTGTPASKASNISCCSSVKSSTRLRQSCAPSTARFTSLPSSMSPSTSIPCGAAATGSGSGSPKQEPFDDFDDERSATFDLTSFSFFFISRICSIPPPRGSVRKRVPNKLLFVMACWSWCTSS
mmetsp:Transcript_30022/g.63882  ORF Transcript_30022/g.63882 Transcript_30022/m.63882 type:complete len:203 (-) Transcript_30022:504-1112(-)